MKGKSKLLILDDWYEEFEPGTYVEDTLERTIIARSVEVLNNFLNRLKLWHLNYQRDST